MKVAPGAFTASIEAGSISSPMTTSDFEVIGPVAPLVFESMVNLAVPL